MELTFIMYQLQGTTDLLKLIHNQTVYKKSIIIDQCP